MTDNLIKIAALIGGGGRLKVIEAGTRVPDAGVELALVVSFKRHSAGLEWAREQEIPTEYLRWSEWKARGHSRLEFDAALAELLHAHAIELVVLAGWGLLLSPRFLTQFPNRIINVHPALLTDQIADEVALEDGRHIPVFRGNHALEEAWEADVLVTGCTVHYVTTEMDVGPIILKREVPRLPDDTLEMLTNRVHAAEDEILPQAIEIVRKQLQNLI